MRFCDMVFHNLNAFSEVFMTLKELEKRFPALEEYPGTGCCNKRDVFMFHHYIASFKSRFLYSNRNIIWSAGL